MGDLQFLNHHPRGNELSKSSSKSGAMARRGENFPSHRPSWKISKNTIWLADCVVYIYCIKSMYYISFYLYLYRYHSNKLVSTQVHIPAWLSKKRCDFDQHEGVKESTWWCEQQKWGVNPCGIHSGINFFPSDFLLVSNWIPIWTKRETDATDVFFRQFPGGTRVGTMIGPSKRTSERRPVRHRCSRTRKTGTNTNTWHH
jgi:hypothetical protein